LKTEIKEKKNSRFSRNKILRERYLQRLSQNRRENNEINYKNSEEFFQLLNNQTFFDGNFTVIEKIERRLDVIICRLG
jgi:ribosomal protein S4